MSAPAEVIEEILVCALCDREIFPGELAAVAFGQDFHDRCSLLFRLERLEGLVSGLSYREKL